MSQVGYQTAQLRYQTDTIQTASDDQLGLMLFEAALRAAKECQQAIRTQDWSAMEKHGTLVQDTMAYLADSVNSEHPQADVMRGLYLYCWRTAAFVQIDHEAENLDGVIDVLETFVVGLKTYLRQADKSDSTSTLAHVNFSG